nr:MAG TPA: HdeA/HdeB family [Caudoviricetes sp.]
MDAVKFIYEARRRYKVTGQVCSVLSGGVEPESIVKELEEWCKEHPAKTRQSVFLEHYPNADILPVSNTLSIYPCNIDKSLKNTVMCFEKSCKDCRKNFWSQEVE